MIGHIHELNLEAQQFHLLTFSERKSRAKSESSPLVLETIGSITATSSFERLSVA